MNRTVKLALIWLCAAVFLAVFATILASSNPTRPVAPPLLSPSEYRPLGTDHLGRDEYSRLVYGARLTIGAALAATVITVTIGLVLGALAALGGEAPDRIVVGLSNAALAIPGLLLAMLLIAALEPGFLAIILAIGLGAAPGFTRMSRSIFNGLKTADYVLAARAAGASQPRVIVFHILPNSVRRLSPLATINFAWAIMGVTTLTFLGLAGDPSIPEWGVMLNDGRGYMLEAPRLVLFPGILISLTVISVHAIGKWIASPNAEGN